MRASVGVGVGPARVSQGIGLPGVGALVLIPILTVAGWSISHWRGLLVGYGLYCLLVWAAIGLRAWFRWWWHRKAGAVTK